MNAKQRTKRRVYAKLGRGVCHTSARWPNDGREVRGKLKRTGVRFVAHTGFKDWRVGSKKGGWK